MGARAPGRDDIVCCSAVACTGSLRDARTSSAGAGIAKCRCGRPAANRTLLVRAAGIGGAFRRAGAATAPGGIKP